MEFSQRDMAILVSMPIAIILLNFAFTGVGLADDSVNKNEIPEFSISTERYNLFGDFPSYPGDPSAGRLTYKNWSNNQDNYFRVIDAYKNSSGTDIRVGIDVIKNVNQNLSVGIFEETETAYNEKRKLLDMTGKPTTITYNVYKVEFSLKEEIETTDGTLYTINYRIIEDRDTSSGSTNIVERIPVLGDIFSATEELAQVVAWIGSVIAWSVKTIFELIVAMVLTIFEAVSFVVNLVTWILSSYSNIITQADGFASIFMVIPTILLGMELLKISFIVVHLLPTT